MGVWGDLWIPQTVHQEIRVYPPHPPVLSGLFPLLEGDVCLSHRSQRLPGDSQTSLLLVRTQLYAEARSGWVEREWEVGA